MLVRELVQIVELRHLTIGLGLEENLPRLPAPHTRSQHLQPVLPDLTQADRLALGRVELDGRLSAGKERRHILHGGLVGGEDVDVVEIGEDELVGAKGGDKLGEEGTDSEGEQKGSEGVALSNALGGDDGLRTDHQDRPSPVGPSAQFGIGLGQTP